MTESLHQQILEEFIATFEKQKTLGDNTLKQLSEGQFHLTIEQNSNSIATIINHLQGNMKSRWTDFLTTDGEKEYRNRDLEFEISNGSKVELMESWEEGWGVLLSTLRNLSGSDLGSIIYIRKEPHIVYQAILRQISHYAYHLGQIVYLAKLIREEHWESLSIPKNQSNRYHQHAGKFKYNS